jgi:hypothetical protein
VEAVKVGPEAATASGPLELDVLWRKCVPYDFFTALDWLKKL